MVKTAQVLELRYLPLRPYTCWDQAVWSPQAAMRRTAEMAEMVEILHNGAEDQVEVAASVVAAQAQVSEVRVASVEVRMADLVLLPLAVVVYTLHQRFR